MRTHYGPWQPCWISNQHQKHKSGRGPSSEHFWQVWLKSVQRFQRRRFKCEKVTDGRRTLTHDKSSHGLWPGELKRGGGGGSVPRAPVVGPVIPRPCIRTKITQDTILTFSFLSCSVSTHTHTHPYHSFPLHNLTLSIPPDQRYLGPE